MSGVATSSGLSVPDTHTRGVSHLCHVSWVKMAPAGTWEGETATTEASVVRAQVSSSPQRDGI